jgi:hypothetical protein
MFGSTKLWTVLVAVALTVPRLAPAAIDVTGQFLVAGGTAEVYVNGALATSGPMDGSGNYSFLGVAAGAGDTVVVVQDAVDGAAAFTIAGAATTIVFPSIKPGTLLVTTEETATEVANTDLFTGFTGVPASRHPFDGSIFPPDVGLDSGYNLIVAGATDGVGTFRTGGWFTMNLAQSATILSRVGGGHLILDGGFSGLGSTSVTSGTLEISGDTVLQNPVVNGSLLVHDDLSIGGPVTVNGLFEADGAGYTIEFSGGNTVLVSGTLLVDGAGPGKILLRSNFSPVQWLLNIGAGFALFDDVDVQDSDATPGPTAVATDSIDSGNNLNWSFSPPTTTTTTTSTSTSTTTTTICSAVPLGGCIAPTKAVLLVKETTTGKEKVKVVLKQLVPVVAQGDFGDPVDGSTVYSLCLYDDTATLAAALEVARAGQDCGTPPRPCWQAISTKGYKYKDKDASAAGVAKIVAKGGDPLTGKVVVKAANNAAKGQTSLPTGIAPQLENDTQATVQLVTSDAACFGVTTTNVLRADGALFKALEP